MSDEQSVNMPYIRVTFEVSRLGMLRDLSDEQPLNMYAVLVISEQSNPVKSTLVKLLHE